MWPAGCDRGLGKGRIIVRGASWVLGGLMKENVYDWKRNRNYVSVQLSFCIMDRISDLVRLPAAVGNFKAFARRPAAAAVSV
jgi:hypothetical protein